jgi:hypothetical protein
VSRFLGRRSRVGGEGGSRTHRFRQPEIEHLDDAVAAQLDIGRLQVAMDDPMVMSGVERVGDLTRNPQRFVEWNRSLRDSIGLGVWVRAL